MLRLWDSVTPLVLILRSCVRKAINLVTYFEFGNIFWIKNIFVLLNSSLEREVMIKKRKIFQFYENFTLVWRDLHKMEINVWSPDLQYNSSNFPVDNFNFKLTFLKSFKSDSKDIFSTVLHRSDWQTYAAATRREFDKIYCFSKFWCACI